MFINFNFGFKLTLFKPLLPYSAYQSAGYKILRDLQNDGIAQGEFYWAHFFPTSRPRSLLFITNTYIYMLKKTLTEIFSVWELIKKPISIYKIKLEKRDIKQNNLNNRKSVIDINTTTQSAPVATTITDLIVRKLFLNFNSLKFILFRLLLLKKIVILAYLVK